jgi:hypothetical protein
MLIFYFWSDFERVFMCSFWWEWPYKSDGPFGGSGLTRGMVLLWEEHYKRDYLLV